MRRRVLRYTALLCCLLASAPTAAADTEQWLGRNVVSHIPFVDDVGGFVQTRNYIDVERETPPEYDYEFRNDIRIESQLSFGRAASGTVSAHQQLDYGVNDVQYEPLETSFSLWEAFIEKSWSGTTIRLGRQVIRWGKADEVNPIDNFTPESFREFINFDRADRKLPILNLNIKQRISRRIRWQGIFIPFFKDNPIGRTGEDWEFYFHRQYRQAFALSSIPEKTTVSTARNFSYANRLRFEGGWGDASLSYAYHFDQNPIYAVVPPLDPTLPPGVEAQWKRLHSIGTDFETVVKGFGIRGEAVFVQRKPYLTFDPDDRDRVQRKDAFNTVVGFDYTTSGDLYLNFQLTQDFIPKQNALMHNKDYEASATFRVKQKLMREQLELQATGRVYLNLADYFYKVDLLYKPGESWDIGAGVIFFGGDTDRIFGQFKRNDQFFVTVKRHFYVPRL